jgi:hypothetical protein
MKFDFLKTQLKSIWRKLTVTEGHNFFNYDITSDYIRFRCTNPENDLEAMKALDEFLVDISENHNVFVDCYRLPASDELTLMEATAIRERFHYHSNIFSSAFYLSEAKIRTQYCDLACEIEVYFFGQEVLWPEFLSMPKNFSEVEAMKNRKLKACFLSVDEGTDFHFLSCKSFEAHFWRLIERLSNCGFTKKDDKYFLPNINKNQPKSKRKERK